MIFIGHPGQGPTVLIVPTRPPSGDLEVLDQTSVRVYVSFAGEILVCLEVGLRSGVGTAFSGTFGELDVLGQVGELLALAEASEGLSALLRTGEDLDSRLEIGDPLGETAMSGGLERPARLVEVSNRVTAGGFSRSAKVAEVTMTARGGGDLEMTAAACE